MKVITTETKVGGIILIGLAILVYMSLKVGGLSLFREEGYHLVAVLATASGLNEKSTVRVAGVDVGKVGAIVLVEEGVRLDLLIRPGVSIRRGGYVVVRASGLLGDHHIEIVPGKEEFYLKNGEMLPSQSGGQNLDNLMERFSDIANDVKAVTAALREIVGTQETKDSFKEIISRTQGITRLVYNFVDDNRGALDRSVSNIETFSESLKDQSSELLASLTNLTRKMERGEGTIGKLLQDEEAYQKLSRSLDGLDRTLKNVQAITQKVVQGEGTIGKLFTDDKAYENFSSAVEGLGNAVRRIEKLKTYVGFRGEHQLSGDEKKGYFSLRLQPRTDKYYLFEVVDDPHGNVTEESRVVTVGGVATTTSELTTQRKLKFSAQFGRRATNLGLRVGLMESSFGLGADYLLADDAFNVSLNAWDFNSNDPESKRPHLKLSAGYTLFDHFRFEAGYDQVLNRPLDTYYVGAGLHFEDDDLKYLMGGLSSLAK